MNQRWIWPFVVTLMWVSLAHSSAPKKAQFADFKEWSQGKLEGVALDSNGALTLAPMLQRLVQDVPGPIVDAAMAENGDIFFTTPSPARIWRFDGKSPPKKLFELDRPLIPKLAFKNQNELIALSGPEGGVHFIPIKKPWQARFVSIPDAHMLMDVAVTSFGIFVVGGGEESILWLVEEKKGPKRIAQLEDNMLTLVKAWPGKRETLVLGSGSDGRVFKFQNGSLSALYQSKAKEVTGAAFDDQGALYVGFSSEKKGLTEGGTQRDQQTDKMERRNKKSTASYGELVRIGENGNTEILWQSKKNHIHDVKWNKAKNTLWVATGPHGRIFSVDPKGEEGAGIWVEIPDHDEIVRLMPQRSKNLYIATAHSGALWRANEQKSESLGIFTSSVFDAGATAEVGFISWEPNAARNVEVRVRTGNSSNPNEGWNGFNVRLEKPGNVVVPPGRYIQVQVQTDIKGRPGDKVLDAININYQLKNRSPEISQMTISVPNLHTWRTFQNAEKSRSVTFDKEAHKSVPESLSKKGKKLKGNIKEELGYRTVHVIAEDPDDDLMRYRFRLVRLGNKKELSVQEKDWSEDPFWSVNTTALASGTYRVKVDVDDALTNGLKGSKIDSDETALFHVSHQGPMTIKEKTKKKGSQLDFVVTGQGAQIMSVVCVLQDGWLPLKSVDGIVDSMEEAFTVDLKEKTSLTCRFEDESGNTNQEEIWSSSW